MKKVMVILLMAMLSLSAWGQKIVLSGTVVNERNGNKISLAVVSVPHTNVTVVTNDDGFFTLKVDEAPHTIVVSHLGFESKEVPVPNTSTDGLVPRNSHEATAFHLCG